MRSVMCACVVLVLLLAGSASLAQMHGDSLRGVVTAQRGPLPTVRIRLQKLGVTVLDAFVHEDRFEFWNVEPGSYTLVAEAPGYETVREEINVPGERPVIDLRPQRNAARGAESASVEDLKVPESARRQFEAALGKLRENNCPDALGHLKKAIRSFAEYGDAHEAMGECYSRMNQPQAAEEEFKRALQQPHRPQLHLLLARAYERQGKRTLIPRQLELYVEEKPNQQRGPK